MPKRILWLIIIFTAVIATPLFTSCGGDDEPSGGNKSSFTINGASFSAEEMYTDCYLKFHEATSGRNASYDGSVTVTNHDDGLDGYHMSIEIILYNAQSLKNGMTLGNDMDDDVYFELEHFFSYTNVTGSENEVEYISGSVVVDKVSASSLTLNFKKYKIHISEVCDRGDYVLDGKLTFEIRN